MLHPARAVGEVRARHRRRAPHPLAEKWRPQSWPSHNSKPELMKPGTMTTGWCGFLPAARACAPGEGDPRLPLPLNAVVLSAGKPLSRCMEELSQCGMACSTRSWKASGMAPIGMARRYTARHATQTNAARRFTRSTRAFADWRFVRETTRPPSFAGFFGAASRFFPFEAPGAEAPDAAFFAFPRDEGSSAGSLSSTFRPRRRTAPVAGFAIGALFDRTEGALVERARDCVVGRSETRQRVVTTRFRVTSSHAGIPERQVSVVSPPHRTWRRRDLHARRPRHSARRRAPRAPRTMVQIQDVTPVDDDAARSGERLRLAGNAAYNSGDFEAAARSYRDSLEAAPLPSPSAPKALGNLAKALLMLGHPGEALANAERYVQACPPGTPDAAKARFRKGEALEATGDLRLAREAYRDAAKDAPGDEKVRGALARVSETIERRRRESAEPGVSAKAETRFETAERETSRAATPRATKTLTLDDEKKKPSRVFARETSASRGALRRGGRGVRVLHPPTIASGPRAFPVSEPSARAHRARAPRGGAPRRARRGERRPRVPARQIHTRRHRARRRGGGGGAGEKDVFVTVTRRKR